MNGRLNFLYRRSSRPLLGIALAGLGFVGLFHLGSSLAYLLYNGWGDTGRSFEASFEDGDLLEWSHLGAIQRSYDGRITVQDEIVASGQQAARMVLDAADPSVKGSKRTEFRLRSTLFGEAVSYQFSLFIPEDWQADDVPVTVAQWHGAPDKLLLEKGRPPPLRLAVFGDEIFIIVLKDESIRSRKAVLLAQEATIVYQAPLQRGAWQSWQFDVLWSPREKGRLDVFLDGQQVGSHQGGNAYRDVLTPYLKLGLYIPAWANADVEALAVRERTIYLDNVLVTPRALAEESSPSMAQR